MWLVVIGAGVCGEACLPSLVPRAKVAAYETYMWLGPVSRGPCCRVLPGSKAQRRVQCAFWRRLVLLAL